MKTKALAAVIALSLTFALFTAFSFSSAADVAYWDGTIASGFEAGDGSENSPYQIKNAAQLAYFLNRISKGTTYSGKVIVLVGTILVNSPSMFEYDSRGSITKPKTNVGMHSLPSGGEFKGIFSGNGFGIFGVYGAPLFSYVSTGALLRVWLTNSCMTAGAGLAKKLGKDGMLYGCGSDATVWSDFTDYVGSMVMHNDGGKLIYCYNTGVVYGRQCVGGLVGYNANGGIIYGGMNEGYISGSSTIGGIVGFQDGESVVNECFNYSAVTATEYCGGIVGANSFSYIYDSYNYGHIKAGRSCGGIAGKNTGYMECCYNIGAVEGEGSICGNADGSDTIVYCYYRNYSGAPTGCGIPLSVAQMKKQESFVGFDFDKVWVMNNENGYEYPQLQSTLNSTRTVLHGHLGLSGEYEVGKNITVDLSSFHPAYEFSENDVVWVIEGVGEVKGKALNIKEEYLGKNILAYVFVSNGKYYCYAVSDSFIIQVPLESVTIEDHAEYGQPLTAKLTPSDATATYQWYANGTAIANQTGKTYTPTADDIGKNIYVAVTGTGGYTGSVNSNEVTVAKGSLGSFSFSGRQQPQNTVKAIFLKKDITADYKWYVDGDAAPDQTAASFKLTEDMVGKTVTLEATGTGNYEGVVKSSFVVSARELKKGDIDANGYVELSDAILVFMHVAGKTNLEDDALLCSDIDNNNDVEIADAIHLFLYVAGKKGI